MTHRRAIRHAATLVGNKAERGKPTADAYLATKYPHMRLMDYCGLLRAVYAEARRLGIVDEGGKRPGAR